MGMKPLHTIGFVFLFSVLTSQAQQFKGGVVAGIVGSQVAGDTYSGYHKAGIYAGMWVRLGISEHSAVQTELVYSQKGSRHNPDEKNKNFTFYLMRLGYVEMPFLYQYQLKNKIMLEAGPSFSVLLHSSENLDYDDISYGKFSLLNPSFIVGIGMPLNERLSAHFRTNSSILSIRNGKINGARYRLFDRGQYNDCLVLSLSYTL